MTHTEILRPLDEHDRANGELGFRFVRALAVEKAALDQSLKPASVRVLAAISYFMNNTVRRSWPGYALIADVTGYSQHAIEAAIRELKAAEYIFTERKSPITGGRALVHYGLCTVDAGEIDAMITAAVAALRKADPAKNQGVRLTHQKTRGSTSDPAVFAASDPTVFASQKPLLMNPKQEGEKKAKQSRGTRLDPEWTLPTQWGDWAIVECVVTEQQVRREANNFRDYWISKPGAAACKLDWFATWRTWIRRGYSARETFGLPASSCGKPDAIDLILDAGRPNFGGGQ